MTTVADLISQSIRSNEIAHAPYSAELAEALSVECEDSAEASETVVEYWGTTEGGSEWRVHLDGEREASEPTSRMAYVSDDSGRVVRIVGDVVDGSPEEAELARSAPAGTSLVALECDATVGECGDRGRPRRGERGGVVSRRDPFAAANAAAAKAHAELAERPGVGWCSHERAAYLMRAPAVAGTGGIMVEHPTIDGWNRTVYPCWGTIGDEPVADVTSDRERVLTEYERSVWAEAY